MSEHSVADARNNLSKLIERALKGEAVVITRHGRPAVELKAVQPPARKVTQADIEWLRARRIALTPGEEGPVDLLIRMRDEDWR